ncbi:hypothetical protein [Clostridium botulinum]|nr:hypothetical protein [Clostridium botulinum]
MSMTYKKCPKCNSTNIVPIIYGITIYEAYLESEKGKIILE